MTDREENPSARRATLRDVARRAGVSVATASNVLNGTKAVRPQTRARVLTAAQDLAYRPNPIARSLIGHRRRGPGRLGAGAARLVSVGYVSIDYVARPPDPPAPGRRVTAPRIDKMLGGPATNVAVAAAALGAAAGLPVGLVTRLGDDEDSRWAVGELAARGVDTSGAAQLPGARLSRAMVIVGADGMPMIVNEPLAVPAAGLESFLAQSVRGAAGRSCVHFDGYHADLAVENAAALHGEGYLLSTHAAGLDPALCTPEGFARLTGTFDLLFLDRTSAAGMAGASAGDPVAALSARLTALPRAGDRPRLVCITLGKAGAALIRPGAEPDHAAARRVEVLDRTGAGDVFTGVFLASWLGDGDAAAALRRACAAATLSITALGAHGVRPDAAALAKAGAPPLDGGMRG